MDSEVSMRIESHNTNQNSLQLRMHISNLSAAFLNDICVILLHFSFCLFQKSLHSMSTITKQIVTEHNYADLTDIAYLRVIEFWFSFMLNTAHSTLHQCSR